MSKGKRQIVTIPDHSYVDTSDPNVKKFCDRSGNWTHYWLVKEKRFVKAVNHILKLGYPKLGLTEYLKNTTAEEADRRLAVAGDEGRRVHNAIRDLAAGLRVTMSTPYSTDLNGKAKGVLNDDEWFNLQTYVAFAQRYPMLLIKEEFSVSDANLGYAGTADRLCTLLVPEDDKNFPEDVRGKWVLVLPDWKTSNRLYAEYKLQISAYWKRVSQLPEYAPFFKEYSGRCFGMLVRLGTKHKCGYEVQVVPEQELESKFKVFLHCLGVADDQQPDFEPEIQDIPTEFYLPMKAAELTPVIAPKPEDPAGAVSDTEVKIKKPKKSRKPRVPKKK